MLITLSAHGCCTTFCVCVQVVDLSLLPHADVTLYIELKPVLPPEAYITGDVRELVGGTVLCRKLFAERAYNHTYTFSTYLSIYL
jgi:hypothetical protein